MTTMNTTEPLTSEEQLFVQRLLACHVMNDTTAKKVFSTGSAAAAAASQSQDDDGNNDETPLDLEEALPRINQQLSKGFGLEIATVVLDRKKYHAVINTHVDDVSKLSEHYNPHERGLIRLIFQALVNDGRASRSTLINLRGDLDEPLKLTLGGAEHVVEMLLEEQWIQIRENNENRRESHQAELELGPRTYLELSHLLVDMGLPQDDLPQFLFHRL